MANAAKILSLGLFAAAPAAFAIDCMTAVPENSSTLTCYANTNWAKTVGIYDKPEYYVGYPVTEDSSFEDFQFVLAMKKLNEAKSNATAGVLVYHNCSIPCVKPSAALLADASAEVKAFYNPAEAIPEQKSSSMSPMMWVLLILGICCLCPLCGLACSCFICYESVEWIVEMVGGKKGAKKSKRSVKKMMAPETEPAMAPVTTTATPYPVYQTVSTAAPVYQTVQHAAPQQYVQYASPMTYASPVTYAAPAEQVQYVEYAAPQQVQHVEYAAPQQVQYVEYAAPQQAQYVEYAAPQQVQYPAEPGSVVYAAPGGSASYVVS